MASSLSDLKQEVDGLLQQGNPSEALLVLKSQEASFENNPEFDYLLGTTALEAGELGVAMHAFERAVLVQPSFAGAWVDLAITYYRMGDAQAAEQIVNHLDENFNPSPEMRAELAQAKKVIGRAAFLHEWHAEVAMLAGHVRNANYGINSTNFQLTPIDGGLINVTLSPDYKPKPDDAYELRMGASKRISYEAGAYSDVQIAARTRQYFSEREQDYFDMAGNWTYFKPLAGIKDTQGVLSATARHLRLNGQTLGNFVNLGAGLKRSYGACAGSGRVEFEERIYEDSDQYNAHIPWFGMGVECFYDRHSIEANYRYGWDSASRSRPGGDIERQELSLVAKWQVSNDVQMRGLIYYADNQDQDGYSPILNHNAKRYIHRQGERLELSWVLPFDAKRRWNFQVELEDIRNRSNIAISRFDDTQVFMGLRYQLF